MLTTASEEVMSRLPGFVSGNFHASTAGTKVANYVQWESAETLEAARTDSAARPHMDRAMAIATHVEPHLYCVEAVHHRSKRPLALARAVAGIDDRPAL